MPETRLFATVCKGCGRILVTVERLGDEAIAVVTQHLRVCYPFDSRGGAPMLGEVMARVTCRTVERV
jgi:hypothetical protein